MSGFFEGKDSLCVPPQTIIICTCGQSSSALCSIQKLVYFSSISWAYGLIVFSVKTFTSILFSFDVIQPFRIERPHIRSYLFYLINVRQTHTTWPGTIAELDVQDEQQSTVQILGLSHQEKMFASEEWRECNAAKLWFKNRSYDGIL